METFMLISNIALWATALTLGFLLLGVLRAYGVLNWKLEQLEATTPSRRDGLRLGRKAPDFTLPSAAGGDQSLRDFRGRKVLLVFTQSGCGPCRAIAPELRRVHDQGEYQVVVVNNGAPEETRRWAADVGAPFPVLAQERFSLSKQYQVFATPFAFVLDEKGAITSKGIAGSAQHLGYVLAGAGNTAKHDARDSESHIAEQSSIDPSNTREEVTHV
jgi:methylamine dehydrogenase accessory protein MauD